MLKCSQRFIVGILLTGLAMAAGCSSDNNGHDDNPLDTESAMDTNATAGDDSSSEDLITRATDSDGALDSDTAIDVGSDSNMIDDTAEDSGSDIDTDTGADTGGDSSANICDENVPNDHWVDGIPAYAQCTASQNEAVWSDDGINTSSTQVDAGWVRTQWSSGYQCTEFASRYLKFHWGVMGTPSGDAGTWCDDTPPAGLAQSQTPVHGDIAVFAPGSCGASAVYGHVAVVDTVDTAKQSFEFVEQNSPGRRSCAISTAACFLHVITND